jgi:hypothetical protein
MWLNIRGRQLKLRQSPYLALDIQRPKAKNKDKTELYLRIKLKGNGSFNLKLYLTPHDSIKDKWDHVALPTPIAWTPETYHRRIINIKDLVRQALRDRWQNKKITKTELNKKINQTMDQLWVAQVLLRHQNYPKKQPIHVRRLACFVPFSDNFNLKFDTYDVTGIKHITSTWQEDGEKKTQTFTKRTINVAKALSLPPNTPVWLDYKVLDNAGNTSYTISLPYVRKPEQ